MVVHLLSQPLESFELERLMMQLQAQLHLHVKDKEGYLEAKELEQYLSEQPEIYICGGFKRIYN
jgi:predicted ferric reductase